MIFFDLPDSRLTCLPVRMGVDHRAETSSTAELRTGVLYRIKKSEVSMKYLLGCREWDTGSAQRDKYGTFLQSLWSVFVVFGLVGWLKVGHMFVYEKSGGGGGGLIRVTRVSLHWLFLPLSGSSVLGPHCCSFRRQHEIDCKY